MLTHRHFGRNYPIHSVGHADLVQTQLGDWWSVLLAKRYVDGYTPFARETFLTPVQFEQDTPIFNPGIGKILPKQTRPNLPWSAAPQTPVIDEFKNSTLDLKWNFLRTVHEPWYELDGENLVLQLRPQTLDDLGNPSLVAQRIKHHNFTAAMALDFSSKNPNELAGITLYRRSNCHYLFAKQNDNIVLIKTEKGEKTEVAKIPYAKDHIVLQVEGDGLKLAFKYGESATALNNFGDIQSMSVISFETAEGFNGPFVGAYASSNGKISAKKAKVDWFKYQGH